jgi:hypothetical protein
MIFFLLRKPNKRGRLLPPLTKSGIVLTAMLQAHSFLWNYLWVAPNLYLIALGVVIWKRGLSRQVPYLVALAFVMPTMDLGRFILDIAPWASANSYWIAGWGAVIVESLLKFLVIGEAFSRVLQLYPSLARLGKMLISGFGAVLVLLAALAAAFSQDPSQPRLVAGFHILAQTEYIIQFGLTVFVFLFVAHFKLTWDRLSFGVLQGFGLASCVYLASWAVLANTNLSAHGRTLLNFLGFATFHFYVLLWYYYVLVPGKVTPRVAVTVPEHNLELWNRELERLLQQ